MKSVLLVSGASGEDTESVYRRPETKVLVDVTRYSSEADLIRVGYTIRIV